MNTPETGGPEKTQSSDREAAERLAFAEAALGATGHEVADPFLLEVLDRHAHGETTGEEARELSRQHVLGRLREESVRCAQRSSARCRAFMRP